MGRQTLNQQLMLQALHTMFAQTSECEKLDSLNLQLQLQLEPGPQSDMLSIHSFLMSFSLPYPPFVTRLLLTTALVGSIAYTVCSGSSPSRHLLGILLWRQSFSYLLEVHGHTLRAIRSVHGLVMTSDEFHLVISEFYELPFSTTFINSLINFSNIFLSVHFLYSK